MSEKGTQKKKELGDLKAVEEGEPIRFLGKKDLGGKPSSREKEKIWHMTRGGGKRPATQSRKRNHLPHRRTETIKGQEVGKIGKKKWNKVPREKGVHQEGGQIVRKKPKEISRGVNTGRGGGGGGKKKKKTSGAGDYQKKSFTLQRNHHAMVMGEKM